MLNLLLLLVGFNLALAGVFAVLDYVRRPAHYEDWMRRYVGRLTEAYKNVPEPDLRELVRETLKLAYSYENFTLFRDRAQKGRFVNVDEHGYRHSGAQRPWPPSRDTYNVFFFGGSTTFGWALPDDATIPSQFQELAPRLGGKPTAVYNFSRMAYFSTQERILFEQLML